MISKLTNPRQTHACLGIFVLKNTPTLGFSNVIFDMDDMLVNLEEIFIKVKNDMLWERGFEIADSYQY